MNKEDRFYINDTTYLTKRGEFILGTIIVLVVFGLALTIIGLININFLTPEACRDGFFDIKNTPECFVHRLG